MAPRFVNGLAGARSWSKNTVPKVLYECHNKLLSTTVLFGPNLVQFAWETVLKKKTAGLFYLFTCLVSATSRKHISTVSEALASVVCLRHKSTVNKCHTIVATVMSVQYNTFSMTPHNCMYQAGRYFQCLAQYRCPAGVWEPESSCMQPKLQRIKWIPKIRQNLTKCIASKY